MPKTAGDARLDGPTSLPDVGGSFLSKRACPGPVGDLICLISSCQPRPLPVESETNRSGAVGREGPYWPEERGSSPPFKRRWAHCPHAHFARSKAQRQALGSIGSSRP